MGIPLDGIDLVRVTLEGLHGFVLAELAYVDALIGGARGERGIALPIHVESRGGMERKLLRAVT